MGERIMVNGRELNFNDLPPDAGSSTVRLEAGAVVTDGGRTVINGHGEFETEDELGDAVTASVAPPPAGRAAGKIDWQDPAAVRAYKADRKRAYRAAKAAGEDA